MRLLGFTVVLSVVAVAGCAKSPKEVLNGATRVEVYRIDGHSPERPREGNAPAIDGYTILNHGEDQGPDFARRLADAVLELEAQPSRAGPNCYWPGVAYRFYQDRDAVDLLVCFDCGKYYLGPPSDKRVWETHGGVSKTLVRLTKVALPNDKDIQALPGD
jgi:hypothetical protein